jgi:hypothetical protein
VFIRVAFSLSPATSTGLSPATGRANFPYATVASISARSHSISTNLEEPTRNANKLFTILSCLGFCGWIVPVDPKISELRDAKILVEEEKFLDVDINIKTEADDVLEPPKTLWRRT